MFSHCHTCSMLLHNPVFFCLSLKLRWNSIDLHWGGFFHLSTSLVFFSEMLHCKSCNTVCLIPDHYPSANAILFFPTWNLETSVAPAHLRKVQRKSGKFSCVGVSLYASQHCSSLTGQISIPGLVPSCLSCLLLKLSCSCLPKPYLHQHTLHWLSDLVVFEIGLWIRLGWSGYWPYGVSRQPYTRHRSC